MSGATNFAARALIIGSGITNQGAEGAIAEILAPFQHQVTEVQRIDLGGRTIIAVEIALDPAHAEAIATDLGSLGGKYGLDIAMELL